jgi:hypothetical protein
LIASELAALRAAATPALSDIERLERRILAALQIWDSYRAKWALRVEPDLRATLNLIDDLAWLAYRAAHDRALASGQLAPERARLPPLVYTNACWSPFARSREQGYELDEGSGVLRQIDDFEPYLRCMPVPLIGIPWTLAAHLPDAVFVGHEAGHLVEDDLALDTELREVILAALPGADELHRQAWSRHWRSEVFADLWGVLCCGPAYALTLADRLVGAPGAASQAQPDAVGRWSAYPTPALRHSALVQALRCLGFEGDAQAMQARWLAACPQHAMPAFDADVAAVVCGLLRTPLRAFATSPGGAAQPLTSVLSFGADMQQTALADAQRALAQRQPLANDVRTLFAGLALAFLNSPQDFVQAQAQQRFVERLKLRRSQGVRSMAFTAKLAAKAPKAADVAAAKAARRQAAASAFLGLTGR